MIKLILSIYSADECSYAFYEFCLSSISIRKVANLEIVLFVNIALRKVGNLLSKPVHYSCLALKLQVISNMATTSPASLQPVLLALTVLP